MPCLHRNGEITGYTVVARIGITDITEFVNSDARSATVSGLEPSTQYTVSVAAVNDAGTGPSTSIIVETGGESVYMWFINLCMCPCAWEGLIYSGTPLRWTSWCHEFCPRDVLYRWDLLICVSYSLLCISM